MSVCGIPGVGLIPFGVHLCHFYSQRRDLIDLLLPYFEAGLRNRERCVWITAAPLPADEASTLAKNAPGIAEGSEGLRIVDAREWYGSDDSWCEAAVTCWLEAEEEALTEKCKGLRIAINTSFVPSTAWEALMRYEIALGKALKDRRIVALCSFDALLCSPTRLYDVISNHDCALDRTGDEPWRIIDRPQPAAGLKI
jgi:hypothetical protein